jgi:hypothetical protein
MSARLLALRGAHLRSAEKWVPRLLAVTRRSDNPNYDDGKNTQTNEQRNRRVHA